MEALFHLSIPVDDLQRAKAFYIDLLGCSVGREARGRFDISRPGKQQRQVASSIPTGIPRRCAILA